MQPTATESTRKNAPRYIPHRADGGFVVFDNRPVGTVSHTHQNRARSNAEEVHQRAERPQEACHGTGEAEPNHLGG